MCPPSAIFPHNRTLLFAVTEFAAHLRYIGAYGPVLGYGPFICYYLCTNRRFLDFSSLLRRVLVHIVTQQPFTVQKVHMQPTYVHFVLFLPLFGT